MQIKVSDIVEVSSLPTENINTHKIYWDIIARKFYKSNNGTDWVLLGPVDFNYIDSLGFITIDDVPEVSLDGYATQTWVNEQGFLKANSLVPYATQDWVTSILNDYATQDWVTSQGFLTSENLTDYVTSENLTAQLQNYSLESNFLVDGVFESSLEFVNAVYDQIGWLTSITSELTTYVYTGALLSNVSPMQWNLTFDEEALERYPAFIFFLIQATGSDGVYYTPNSTFTLNSTTDITAKQYNGENLVAGQFKVGDIFLALYYRSENILYFPVARAPVTRYTYSIPASSWANVGTEHWRFSQSLSTELIGQEGTKFEIINIIDDADSRDVAEAKQEVFNGIWKWEAENYMLYAHYYGDEAPNQDISVEVVVS